MQVMLTDLQCQTPPSKIAVMYTPKPTGSTQIFRLASIQGFRNQTRGVTRSPLRLVDLHLRAQNSSTIEIYDKNLKIEK